MARSEEVVVTELIIKAGQRLKDPNTSILNISDRRL